MPCGYCIYYIDGYCKYHKRYISNNEVDCRYFQPCKELPLLPGGQRLAAVAAGKHITLFVKRKRGPTDPTLTILRQALRLPPGYRLLKSKASPGSLLFGAIHIKEPRSGRIIKTLLPEDIKKIIDKYLEHHNNEEP